MAAAPSRESDAAPPDRTVQLADTHVASYHTGDRVLLVAGGAREEILDRSRAVGFTGAQLVGVLAADEVEVLRQRDQARTCRGRGGDQPAGGLEVGRHLGCRHHLQSRNARLAQGVPASFGAGAAFSFTTFGSAQPPLTANSWAKIWPSGFLSTRCATAAATPA